MCHKATLAALRRAYPAAAGRADRGVLRTPAAKAYDTNPLSDTLFACPLAASNWMWMPCGGFKAAQFREQHHDARIGHSGRLQ